MIKKKKKTIIRIPTREMFSVFYEEKDFSLLSDEDDRIKIQSKRFFIFFLIIVFNVSF